MNVQFEGWLLGRFLRSRRGLACAVPALVAMVLLMLLTEALQALTLSRSQTAERDLGVWNAGIKIVAPVGDRLTPTEMDRLTSALRSRGAKDVGTQITSTDAVPDAVVRVHATGAQPAVTYIEQAGLREAFPASYRLTAGSWPTVVGEVMLSRKLADVLGSPHSITVFSGAARLSA